MCPLSGFSLVQLFETLWTMAHQVPLFMGFSRQNYWSGLPRLPPGDLPDPGIKPGPILTFPTFVSQVFFVVVVLPLALPEKPSLIIATLKFPWR